MWIEPSSTAYIGLHIESASDLCFFPPFSSFLPLILSFMDHSPERPAYYNASMSPGEKPAYASVSPGPGEKPLYASESPGYGESPTGEGKLVRQLKNRHVAMIRYANTLVDRK
jgi:hypothetical protein